MAHRIPCSLFVVASAAALLLVASAYAQPVPPDKAKVKQAKAYVDAGLAAQNGNDYDTAIVFYSKAYDLVPHPVLLFNIAQAHRLAGRMDQAINAYQRFLATHPQGAEAQIARDLLDELTKRSAEQAHHLEQATRARKDGRFDDACVELEAAYALDPQPDLLYQIGQAYAKLGKCDEASTFYKRFLGTQKGPQIRDRIDRAIEECKPDFTVARQPSKPPDNARPPPDEPTPAKSPSVQTARTKQVPSPNIAQRHTPWYEDKLGDSLVIGGFAAAVVSLVVYRSALSDLDSAEQSSDYQQVLTLVDRAYSKRMPSIVLASGGTALITAGILRYVLRSKTIDSLAIRIAPVRDGGMVSYARRF